MPKPRGITLTTILIFLGLAAGVYCLFAFGQAYWDNLEVQGILRQAANECYRRRDVRMPIVFDEGDLQIQRTEVPRFVNIWLTYQRKVTLPLVGQERILTFNDHAEQDLSPVRW